MTRESVENGDEMDVNNVVFSDVEFNPIDLKMNKTPCLFIDKNPVTVKKVSIWENAVEVYGEYLDSEDKLQKIARIFVPIKETSVPNPEITKFQKLKPFNLSKMIVKGTKLRIEGDMSKKVPNSEKYTK